MSKLQDRLKRVDGADYAAELGACGGRRPPTSLVNWVGESGQGNEWLKIMRKLLGEKARQEPRPTISGAGFTGSASKCFFSGEQAVERYCRPDRMRNTMVKVI